jgi:4-coumarate--CoA ligase (photoactive yellow protein activation family)
MNRSCRWRAGPRHFSLDRDLAVDSLELLHVAGVLSAARHLHHSGVEDYLLARRTLGGWVDIAETGLGHHDAELTFSSSGSTGQPKRCSHATDRLEQEGQALAMLFPGRRRQLVDVPAHHIYGFLFTQLLPRHLGLDPIQVTCIRTQLPARLARIATPGDLVIGHPAFWEAALAGGIAFPPDVVGVSSTAPCPDGVAERAEAFGLAALIQVYGSSETGGLGWRSSHRDDYRLLPYLERDGKHERCLLRTLPSGGTETVEARDWLRWSGARTFAVGARHDGAVQVGGVNVFPARAREILLGHPAVADCTVRLMRPDEGVRLKAFIVPRVGCGVSPDGERELLNDLRTWIDTRFAALERPKALTLGSRLPRNELGKAADWNIA